MNHTETATKKAGVRHPRKKAVSVQFDQETLDKLRRKAAEIGVSLAAFLRIATLRMVCNGCKTPEKSHLRSMRSRTVSVQFDQETLDKLRRAAAEAGLSLAAFLRIATLRMVCDGCETPN